MDELPVSCREEAGLGPGVGKDESSPEKSGDCGSAWCGGRGVEEIAC